MIVVNAIPGIFMRSPNSIMFIGMGKWCLIVMSTYVSHAIPGISTYLSFCICLCPEAQRDAFNSMEFYFLQPRVSYHMESIKDLINQINKLQDIARSVANVNTNDYSGLESMLDCLEDLKYAIQDRKVDALVVETFGRRIEKLLQEKYVHLCGLIEDEKGDLSNAVADDDRGAFGHP